jgi:SAM-dependent methyltransferase
MVLHGSTQTPDQIEGEHRRNSRSHLDPSEVAPAPPRLPTLSTDRDALAISADGPTESDPLPCDLLATRDPVVSQASSDGDLVSILARVANVPGPDVSDEPLGRDHLCTMADFVVGPVARFEANVAAIALLKRLAVDGRPPTPEERVVLASFSGFGDSTFEPAFQMTVHRPDDHAWVERGQRLRSLLDDAEWQSVERSRLNAFFTSPDVITAIWDGLLALGLDRLPAPRILEPAAGVGRFLGLQPTDIAARSVRTAVELDTLTARMLKALYPRVAVHSIGFQDAPLRDNSFDLAISNAPFGDFPVVDRAYLKASHRFLARTVHNYFFVKALRKLRPGGVLAFITSRYTLDAPRAEPIRAHLHQQADLVAAVRLPAGTFPDTDVVTDLVILRKRMAGEVPRDETWLRSISQTYIFQRPQPAHFAPSAWTRRGEHRSQRVFCRSSRDGARYPRGVKRRVRRRLHRRAARRWTRGNHRDTGGAHASAALWSPCAGAAQHRRYARVASSAHG